MSMRLRLCAIALFFFGAMPSGFSIAASGASSEESWQRFTSKPGRFSVQMPAAPEQFNTQTKSFIGTITTHVFVARGGDEEYAVSYSDLPGFAVTFAGSNTIYSHAKGSLLMETLGKEQKFEDAALNGMSGKHLVYDMPDPQTKVDMRGEAYFFLIDKRLYVIDVNVPLGELPTDGPRFFSSFRVE